MKEKKQETTVQLSTTQLQTVLYVHILKEKGLNEVFTLVLNGLMYAELQTFLEEAMSSPNKGNGNTLGLQYVPTGSYRFNGQRFEQNL